jgi:hypothetical protein
MKKSSRVWLTFAAMASFIVSGMLPIYFVRHTDAQTGSATINPCSVAQINLASGVTLQPLQPVSVYITANTTTSLVVDRVLVLSDGQPIGKANQVSTYTWNMPWLTSLSPLGIHQVSARILYNQGSTCDTAPVAVNNSTPPNPGGLMLDIAPQSWTGLTNSSFLFNTNVRVNDTTATALAIKDYALLDWTADVGAVQTRQGVATYFSGPVAGSGQLHIIAVYGGASVTKNLTVSVQSQISTATPPPTTAPTTTSTTAGAPPPTNTTTPSASTTAPTSSADNIPPPLTKEQKVELATKQLDSQPVVLSCAIASLPQNRINDLRSQTSRLSPKEFEAIKNCFTQTNFTVPSVYAPVDPEKVRTDTLKSSETSRIVDAKTQINKKEDGKSSSSLRFQGSAKPNSDVLLYVYSEPLVLYARADANGNWVYDLVDPLESGNHKAYAVVEETDGTYKKSSPFSFIINTAQASAENPNGYSLSVQTIGSLAPSASKSRTNLYVIGAAVLIVAIMGIGTFVLTRTLKHIPADTKGPEDTDIL